MMPKYITGLDGLASLMGRLSVEEKVVIDETMGAVSHIVRHHVKEVFGDKTRLAALAPFTQAERTEAGYSPDEPLLRSGELLKDKVECEHLGPVARVGTPEVIQAYHELGYVNARSGTSVPPRPVFKIGLMDSKDDVLTAVEDGFGFIFLGRIQRRVPEAIETEG